MSGFRQTVSYECLESHQKGKAVGREEVLKQQTFSGPEWFQPFRAGTDPSPTSSKPCGLPHCLSALEGKQGRLITEHRPFSTLQGSSWPGGLGAVVPLKGPGQGLSEPLCGDPGADVLALGFGRVGRDRAGHDSARGPTGMPVPTAGP